LLAVYDDIMRPPNIVPYLNRVLFAPTEAAVTALVVAIYAAVFISSIAVYESVPAAPKPQYQRGLHLEQAWRDLQLVCCPYLDFRRCLPGLNRLLKSLILTTHTPTVKFETIFSAVSVESLIPILISR
jgi:hypothetical protein